MTLLAPDTLSPHICRSETGALDIPCHERRARRLRAQAIQQWLDGLGHLLLRFWNCLRDCARSIATRRELAALDQRTLKDIGLAPADLPAVADGSFLEDATRRQRALPHPVCWMNGTLVALDQARVSVFDHGLLYGDGVFEGIRFYHGRSFRLDAHLDRLYRSAAALRLTIPYDRAALIAATNETIAAFGARNGYLRLVVTRGEGRLGLDPSTCARGNTFILADHLALVSEDTRDGGARLIVAATRRLSPDGLDPRIKSLNYLNHILARMEATNAGADEAILLNAQGRVAEGTADNIFIVRSGALLTPPATDGALEGITRAVVLGLAAALHIPARETSLATYDLYTADEAFLTGTGAELIPVREVDGRTLGACPGPVFARLMTAFRIQIEQETLHAA
ncbi:MAG: branched-chain-amino-acid transaminase [Burkholderiales bacterium]|nr:branched-chain-amino-acid transaminase [Burkholderiales bacterium]